MPTLERKTNTEGFLCQVLKSEHFVTPFDTEIEMPLTLALDSLSS